MVTASLLLFARDPGWLRWLIVAAPPVRLTCPDEVSIMTPHPPAPSPSGKAADCKSAIPGSNPGGAFFPHTPMPPSCLALLALLLAGTAAGAHDYWLLPAAFFPAVDKSVAVSLH